MSPRRLVAVLVALALGAGAALGGATAGADPMSSGGPRLRSGLSVNGGKRSKAARCAQRRRAAKRPRERGATSRRPLRGCGSGRGTWVGAKRPAGAIAGRSPGSAGAVAPPAASGSVSTPGTGGDGASTPQSAGTPPPVAPIGSTLGVGAWDISGFLLRLTKTSVPAGMLTIFFRNNDVSDHNLWISGPGGDVVERISDTVGENGGGSRTLPVTPGAWRLFCALPDHDKMTRTLTVTP